jgi:Mn2+/Fe2+ NRAMP family transporter
MKLEYFSPIFMSLPFVGIGILIRQCLSILNLHSYISVLILIIVMIMMLYFANNKRHYVNEAYPFQDTLEAGLNLHRILHYMLDKFEKNEKNGKLNFAMKFLVEIYHYDNNILNCLYICHNFSKRVCH